MNLLLDVFGFEPHEWPSVERTRKFYAKALQSAFELRPSHNLAAHPIPAAALNFSSDVGWRFAEHPPYPLVFAMHGGPVLDQLFLQQHLGALRPSDILVVNCTSDISLMTSMFRSSHPLICHLPLPVDETLFRPGSRLQARSDIGVTEFDYVLGFVARFVPQKNLHRFIRLIGHLNDILTPLTVGGIVIGKYWLQYEVLPFETLKYDLYIANLISELGVFDRIVCFSSDLADDDLVACYRAMDLLYHPTHSIDENFGYVPVEAQACGIPVIGTAYGGLKDTVEHQVTGWLLDTWVTMNGIRMNDIGLLELCRSLLLNAGRRERAGQAGRSRILAKYTYEPCARQLVSSIMQAIAMRAAAHVEGSCDLRSIDVPPRQSDLPALQPPWETYIRPVSFYASQRCPAASPNSLLRVAARLTLAEEAFACDDPAWPCRGRVSRMETRILRECDREVCAAQVMARCGCELCDLSRLLERGLLVCDAGSEERARRFAAV
jgi:glycosyltransferase involved in cell wall biosynthesis